MPSLIPGYEYDIFISYRQKDNKGDKWVSEFVDALKSELESTFKEEISIYFDINPHDGLLETHDVDASLKDKLKCLVFIPILSRTYCDPKSFAWKNEFEVFVEQASRDQSGLKVKLPNGNVASRVLPVRIHDLDISDIKLCESLIGQTLRDIEFIYSSEGVNRPLRSREDKPNENLNKTVYRDQVNKTALAIKEIILGLKGEPDLSVAKSPEHREQELEFYKVRKPSKPPKRILQTGTAILVLLLIAAFFVWPGLTGRNKLKSLVDKEGKIPVAIMPFKNMTNDTAWDIWQDGIQSILITNLSNSEDLNVRKMETTTSLLQNEGVTNYASLSPSIAGLIAGKLETNINIQGSIKQSGNTIRVNAQLIDTKTGEAFQSFQIDGTTENILPVIDTLSIRMLKFIIVSVMAKELGADIRSFVKSGSPDALKYYLYGLKASLTNTQTALEWYQKAVLADSNFFDGLNNLWFTYLNLGRIKEGKEVCRRIYRKKDIWNPSQRLWADYQYAYTFQTPVEQIECLKRVIEDDEFEPSYHFVLGTTYNMIGQYEKAIPELERTLEICKEWKMAQWAAYLINLGDTYHKAGEYRKEKKIYRETEKNYPDNPFLHFNQAVLALTEGDSVAARQYIDKYISPRKDRGDNDASIIDDLGMIYSEAGINEKAEEYYRKALSLEPERPVRLAKLGYFMIDTDRNVDEGIELIEEAIKLNPPSFNLFHYKGWGLYKQGKYPEALDLLQKSWDMRMERARYDHAAFLHLEAARKAVAGMN